MATGRAGPLGVAATPPADSPSVTRRRPSPLAPAASCARASASIWSRDSYCRRRALTAARSRTWRGSPPAPWRSRTVTFPSTSSVLVGGGSPSRSASRRIGRSDQGGCLRGVSTGGPFLPQPPASRGPRRHPPPIPGTGRARRPNAACQACLLQDRPAQHFIPDARNQDEHLPLTGQSTLRVHDPVSFTLRPGDPAIILHAPRRCRELALPMRSGPRSAAGNRQRRLSTRPRSRARAVQSMRASASPPEHNPGDAPARVPRHADRGVQGAGLERADALVDTCGRGDATPPGPLTLMTSPSVTGALYSITPFAVSRPAPRS